ncbi:hypothetical protein X943_000480 [Babesia divergens]|uniref:S1 motif domain-containing protein n=1 Tax=Babesia divergens TaxID=32595 RepID=A0AAD9G6I2_BABDI|nr:hypothetical protein X943_000480 [Babesia divergens]
MDDEEFKGDNSRTSRFMTRGERRRSGRVMRKHRLAQPAHDPWLTDDYGGIPGLPHRTPIALSDEPVNEEFLEMRKREIPHSLLKDHYMHRYEDRKDLVGYDHDMKPIFLRSLRDKYLYLLGDGIMPFRSSSFQDNYDEEVRKIGRHSHKVNFSDLLKRDPTRPSKYSIDHNDVEVDEHVRKARELYRTYTGKDRVCQLLLSSLKDFEAANLNPNAIEEPPENDEIIDHSLDDYFVRGDDGLPIWLKRWNEEYIRGRHGLTGNALAEYDQMWYERLEWLNNRYSALARNDAVLNSIRIEYQKSYENKGLRQLLRRILDIDSSAIAGDDPSATKWSEHIPTFIFETMTKYSLPIRAAGNVKQQMLDLKADSLKSCMHMSMNRLTRERSMKEDEQDRLDYIAFLRQRRNVLKRGRIGPQPNTPYWLWKECWRRRDTIISDTLLEILKDIRAVDPKADLSQLTDGTVEHMKSPKLQGTKFDLQTIFDDTLSSNVAPIEKFINAPTDVNDAAGVPSQYQLSDGGLSSDMKGVPDQTCPGPGSDMGNIPLPKPLGYYFKDVLSYSKFEEAYKKFNMESFGTEEYGVRVGQLVKGRIEVVKPKHMLVDIHTAKLATMLLSDYFERSKDVPYGGFTTIFKKGDELYFEVLSKYGNNIRVSMRRIQKMYKSRHIYRKYFNREIMKVRVLQRYTHGVFVQYQGDDVKDIANYQSPSDLNTVENVAFVPYGELDTQYCNKIHHIRRDIVGKIIPVYINDFVVCNGIPLASNVEALRRLLLPHIKPGDVLRASPCMYGKEAIWLHLGHTIGILPVIDMSNEDYERHKRGDHEQTTAVVKFVDYNTGTVELSSRLLDDSNRHQSVNECLKRLKETPDVVKSYNSAIKQADVITSAKSGWERIDPEANTMHNFHQIPSIKLSNISTPSLPVIRARTGKRTWDAIHWDVSSPDFPENSSSDENHAYNNYKWEVLTEEGWVEVPAAERRVLNRAHYQHDEVVYYQDGNRNYRADLIELVRYNLTDMLEQPLRNNCYVLDDEDAQEINAIDGPDMGGIAF